MKENLTTLAEPEVILKTRAVSIRPEHESDGLYHLYSWIAVTREPGTSWEAVPPVIMIISGMSRAPTRVANVHLTRVKDISHEGTVKIHTFEPGTKRSEAEAWIGTPEGQTWQKGTVGGSLCQLVLSIPK